MKISGIVLAAGESARMGRPKALLPTGSAGESFVSRLIHTFAEAGLDDIDVVGRPTDELLRELVGTLPAARYVCNHTPEDGQLSSLVAGIDGAEARGSDAVLVMPVDMPLIRVATVSGAIAALRNSPAPIVRVAFRGRHGHPVLFRRETFDDLRAADPSVGAKSVVRAYGARVLELPVDDPGVVKDIDLPAEYKEVFGRDP